MKQLAANEGKQHRLSPFQQDFTSSIQQMLLDLSWRSLTESNPSDGEFVELAKGRLQLALLRCALLETVGRRLRLSAAERPTVWYGAVSPEDARGRRQ